MKTKKPRNQLDCGAFFMFRNDYSVITNFCEVDALPASIVTT